MSDQSAAGPRAQYEERLDQRKRETARQLVRERRTSIARVILIALAIAVAFWKVAAALLPIAVFVALVVIHEAIIRARKRAESGAAFYERGLARIDGSWQGKGDPGEE